MLHAHRAQQLGQTARAASVQLAQASRNTHIPRLCSGAGLNRADVCDNTRNDGVPLCVVVTVLSGLPVFRERSRELLVISCYLLVIGHS